MLEAVSIRTGSLTHKSQIDLNFTSQDGKIRAFKNTVYFWVYS